MAYIKALFFLAVVVAAACAAEEVVREKKQVLFGSPYAAYKYTDDGKYYPGKYETPTVPAAVVPGVVPAVRSAVPAVVPAAVPAYAHAAYAAHPYYY
ncbi:uncharacterized protein [Halyomorpha halys]|uniref:uncharacterized protein n=1 Tax=Halyomorpha halys TaxID=286706 RepID=UPI0006D4E6D7